MLAYLNVETGGAAALLLPSKVSRVGTTYWLSERKRSFLFRFTIEKTEDLFNR
jgi:hypothetical protein